MGLLYLYLFYHQPGARGGATSWKVAVSIPNGVIGIFHLHNPSGRIMALGSNKSLTEMNYQVYFLEVKVAGA